MDIVASVLNNSQLFILRIAGEGNVGIGTKTVKEP